MTDTDEREALNKVLLEGFEAHANGAGSPLLGVYLTNCILASDVWRNRRQGPITDAQIEADGIRKAADHLRLMLNGGGRGKGLVWGLLDYADAVERAALEAARSTS